MKNVDNPAAAGYAGITTQTNVYGSRNLGTTYHNTSKLTIFVSVAASVPAVNTLQAKSDATAGPSEVVSKVDNTLGVADVLSIFFIVLPGNYYVAECPGGSKVLWMEYK